MRDSGLQRAVIIVPIAPFTYNSLHYYCYLIIIIIVKKREYLHMVTIVISLYIFKVGYAIIII